MIYIYGEDQIFKRSKLNCPEVKGMMEMTINVKDVKRFWLEHSNIIGAEAELVIEIGEGKRFKYQKTPEAEQFYNNLRFSKDFAEYLGKSLRKSAIKTIKREGGLTDPIILIYLYGYKNPLRIGPDLRVRHSDFGMFDTFEHLKKIFNR